MVLAQLRPETADCYPAAADVWNNGGRIRAARLLCKPHADEAVHRTGLVARGILHGSRLCLCQPAGSHTLIAHHDRIIDRFDAPAAFIIRRHSSRWPRLPRPCHVFRTRTRPAHRSRTVAISILSSLADR